MSTTFPEKLNSKFVCDLFPVSMFNILFQDKSVFCDLSQYFLVALRVLQNQGNRFIHKMQCGVKRSFYCLSINGVSHTMYYHTTLSKDNLSLNHNAAQNPRVQGRGLYTGCQVRATGVVGWACEWSQSMHWCMCQDKLLSQCQSCFLPRSVQK